LFVEGNSYKLQRQEVKETNKDTIENPFYLLYFDSSASILKFCPKLRLNFKILYHNDAIFYNYRCYFYTYGWWGNPFSSPKKYLCDTDTVRRLPLDRFSSTADMLRQYEQQGWKKTKTGRGFTLEPPAKIAEGLVLVWGDPQSHCFIDSDIIFHIPLMERYYFQQKGIQISFIDDMTGTYYQSKAELSQAHEGLFCAVNNIPKPWFHRYPAEARQKVYSIIITESFFSDFRLSLPHNGWDRLARFINNQKTFIPALAVLCQEIKNTTIGDETFEFYFRGKVIEAIGLLLDYTLKMERKSFPAVSEKSRAAAKDALQILNDAYANPPVIEVLAQSVGIDKKTLQNAFKQLAGQSVHDYVQSLRMEKALSLLEEKSLHIEKIAKMLGYQSKINFYKAFECTYGCKPNEIRKLLFSGKQSVVTPKALVTQLLKATE
jgi:AraC-like DNA-binding protein